MEVSVEAMDGLERRMTVQIPNESIDTEVNKRLQEMTRKARIDGFRPGKVPLKVIKGRYGKAVRDEVTTEVVQRSYFEAINQEELRPAGGPSLDAMPTTEGDTVSFSATFEVYPEFEPQGIELISVIRPETEITEQDVDAMVERLRKQRVTWESVDRKAAEGDRVTLDLQGSSADGEDVEGASGKDLKVEIGSGGFVPGFEGNLVGLAKGESKEFTVTFPDDYPVEKLAASDVDFKVDVKEVEEGQLPTIDEAFVSSFGVADGDLASLRGELRRNMARELRQAIASKVRQQVMDGLLEANEIPVPRVLVESEVWRIGAESGAIDEKNAEQRAPLDPELVARLRPAAERRVALGLIVSEIVRRNELEVEETRVEAHIASVASTYEQPEQVRAFYRSNEKAMESIRNTAMEEQFLDWVLEQAKVEDKPMSFDEVVKPDGKSS